MKYLIFLIIFSLSGIIGWQVARFSNKSTVKTIVIGKERIVESSNGNIDSYYLIYTESGTFTLKDEFLAGNFNSSDLYGSIKVNKTYEITIIGFRVGILNMYPNIINIK